MNIIIEKLTFSRVKKCRTTTNVEVSEKSLQANLVGPESEIFLIQFPDLT
jgi:hypothetical protein